MTGSYRIPPKEKLKPGSMQVSVQACDSSPRQHCWSQPVPGTEGRFRTFQGKHSEVHGHLKYRTQDRELKTRGSGKGAQDRGFRKAGSRQEIQERGLRTVGSRQKA